MYFPNGTAGDIFREKYCYGCQLYKFFDHENGEECPVWDLHLDMNYEAVGKNKNETAERALSHFTDEDGERGQVCKIFEAIQRGRFFHDW